MSALTTHIGSRAPEDETDTSCDVPQAGGLGAARACVPPIESQHNGLVKTLWIRRTLEDILAKGRYYIADGQTLGKTTPDDVTKLYFVIDPPLRQYDIPWMVGAHESIGEFALIGANRKMRCPTWDIPAGATTTGGSCPGAQAGQTTVPLQIRKHAEKYVGQEVRLAETICNLCYATGGQYASPHVQAGEIIRYWWCKQMLGPGATAQSREEWVRTVVRAFQGATYPKERLNDPRTGKPVLPVRIHSSGDFFSFEYAEAWIEVCNRLPELLFWAPTRTWAAAGWVDAWPRLLRNIKHSNLVLRPSAYHTNDPAPNHQRHPWHGGYPFTAEGTTSFYKFVDPPAGSFNWQCRTYDVGVGEAHSCRNAVAPNADGSSSGVVGCRACWVQPHLTVNYSAH